MKSYFIGELDVELLESGAWRLREELCYSSESLGAIVTVPEGFETDFASVPRLPVVYLLAGDTAHRPAVVHDFLYAEGVVTRAQADQVLLEAMEVTGVPYWRRYSMYWAVRAFGGSHFKERSNADGY